MLRTVGHHASNMQQPGIIHAAGCHYSGPYTDFVFSLSKHTFDTRSWWQTLKAPFVDLRDRSWAEAGTDAGLVITTYHHDQEPSF